MLTSAAPPAIAIASELRAELDAIACYVCRGSRAVRMFQTTAVESIVGALAATDLPKFCDDHAEMFAARLAQVAKRVAAAAPKENAA